MQSSSHRRSADSSLASLRLTHCCLRCKSTDRFLLLCSDGRQVSHLLSCDGSVEWCHLPDFPVRKHKQLPRRLSFCLLLFKHPTSFPNSPRCLSSHDHECRLVGRLCDAVCRARLHCGSCRTAAHCDSQWHRTLHLSPQDWRQAEFLPALCDPGTDICCVGQRAGTLGLSAVGMGSCVTVFNHPSWLVALRCVYSLAVCRAYCCYGDRLSADCCSC